MWCGAEKDVRVKLKQDDYKRLHAIMTNTSERKIWEAMRAGVPVSETASSVPDARFHACGKWKPVYRTSMMC